MSLDEAEATFTRKPETLDPGLLQQLAGTYETATGFKFQVVLKQGDGIRIMYHLSPDVSSPSWVRMIKDSVGVFSNNHPIVFLIKAEAHDDIELKFVDEDETTFLKRYPLENYYHDWNQVVIYLNETKYGWGP